MCVCVCVCVCACACVCVCVCDRQTDRQKHTPKMQSKVELGPGWIAPRAPSSLEEQVIEIDDDTDDNEEHNSTNDGRDGSHRNGGRRSRKRESQRAQRTSTRSSTRRGTRSSRKDTRDSGDSDESVDEFMDTQAARLRRSRRQTKGTSNSRSAGATRVAKPSAATKQAQTLLKTTAWSPHDMHAFAHHPRIHNQAQRPSRESPPPLLCTSFAFYLCRLLFHLFVCFDP